eukprot:2779441-Prymnesium_polylepis.1
MEMYWLRRGRLRMIPQGGSGFPMIVHAGESFAQACMLENERMACDISALEYSDMLYLARDRLFQICRDYPTLRDE